MFFGDIKCLNTIKKETMNKTQFSAYIKEFNFRELFNEMGWNNDRTTPQPVSIDSDIYTLQSVAEKSGFKILLCDALADRALPDYSTRRKIETRVTKLFHEHLIIFVDADKTEQIWQFVVRQVGKPDKVVETRWNVNQSPELLYQRASGIFFTMDEEERITIVDVTQRMSENFTQNNERVTKRFYEQFKREHSCFLNFITGISERTNREWYASLMLNRLMFCYFIQKKGFLDSDTNYLRKKLRSCRENHGSNKFSSFYRDFLLVLFHQGLNGPVQSALIERELGRIPYLNGGLFDEHEIERLHAHIDIDDRAFERIFDFFDQYEWHLDTSVLSSGRDINPDVIGYIFEKYINDRAAMGAYYTKEDITEYIGKNCILPFLMDAVEETRHATSFKPSGYVCQTLKKREQTSSSEEFALLTEITRKIENGEITQINDFITHNLDIRTFVYVLLKKTDDHLFIKHFYHALQKISILDPTCGSGAFLFAALNMLEPLYEICIDRMEEFHEQNPSLFKEELEEIQSKYRSNIQYYIYKSIILRNLYGVDIMKESTEIAKLRLFLKMVAVVEVDKRADNLGIDPLPDIDFNIRCGNTLIGYANEAELDKDLTSGDMFANQEFKSRVKEEIEKVSMSYKQFKDIQLAKQDDIESFKVVKQELQHRLKNLAQTLNQRLHKATTTNIPYDRWLASYQPFHWFAEFYEIIHDQGGFDVIIGNPPYVSMKQITYNLNRPNFKCSDLFGYVINRCFSVLNKKSRYGFIVMHNLAFSKNFEDVRNSIKNNVSNAWFSFYARIPAGLFSGDVRVRNCIFILDRNENTIEKQFYTTRIHRWFSEARDQLFSKLNYSNFRQANVIPMFNCKVLAHFFENSKGTPLSYYESKKSKHKLYFKQSAYNWISVSNEPAPCYDENNSLISQSQVSDLSFQSENIKHLSLLFLNGKLFFSQWLTYGDEFHATKDDLLSVKVPFELISIEDKKELIELSKQFSESLNDTIQFKLNAGKNVGTFNTSKLWHITDISDKIFLKYLCDNPHEVFAAIENHIKQTVISVGNESEE
jgi:tRNA1(Val) A37 N6-methylase TrmN6